MPQLLILVFSVAVGLYILYCVIRAGVRDGIRAARGATPKLWKGQRESQRDDERMSAALPSSSWPSATRSCHRWTVVQFAAMYWVKLPSGRRHPRE